MNWLEADEKIKVFKVGEVKIDRGRTWAKPDQGRSMQVVDRLRLIVVG